MTYYIAPSFLNKLAVHITKNYLDLPQVKVPLILGIHGRKGEGKTFQCELVFKKMGVDVVHISGGELESPDAGDPARLIRLRYREAAELVRVRGCMSVLMINDLDAGAGRFDRMTQYTVNTQLVNNTLMNIADNPTNVQLPGSYDEKELPRIPIIATGNDFATLYAPLIRDGRMQKFYWNPSYKDRLGIVSGMYASDGLPASDIEKFVETFSNQAIDFFGAVRSQIYDEQITHFIESVGLENVSSRVVNAVKAPTFTRPNFRLEHLIEVGKALVHEQRKVQTMGLVNEYNQALTPVQRSLTNATVRHENRSNPLLTTPDNNPLSPYVLGSKQSSIAESGRSFREMARSQENTPTQQVLHNDLQPAAEATSPHPSTNAAQTIAQIVAASQNLGIEYADKRRFKTNSWQCYATLHNPDIKTATQQVQNCLSKLANHYIRLIGIDSQNKQRITETIVHRP